MVEYRLNNGIVPIVEKFLQPNYLLALQFQEGFIFGRVVRRRICQYKPYAVIDSNGNTVDIDASSHQSELRFRDPRNTENDILYLDEATDNNFPWIFHGAIGIKPQYINMYLRFPEGQTIPGKFPELDQIKPSSGDDLGYINSLNSPYESPTDFVEIVIPPKIHLGAEYYNKDPNRKHQPVLNLLFALYWFEIFNPSRHASIIRKIALREVPAAFLTVGFADRPYQMGTALQNDWKAIPLKLEDAGGL